jgi:hypothetical protein
MWDLLIAACRERNLVLQPEVFHIDFEYAMRIAILTKFPNSTISCCRFHLGQSWWRKIQAVGFNADRGNISFTFPQIGITFLQEKNYVSANFPFR